MYSRVIALAAAVLVAGTSAGPAAAQRTERISVVRTAQHGLSQPIPNRFIVTVAPRNDPGVVASAAGLRADRVYRRVLNGFVATLSDLTQSRLLQDYRVIRIEQDRTVTATTLPKSWGIDRVDQRRLPLNNSYDALGTGLGVSAFVVDSGIRFDHTLFGGRAVRGIDVINDGYNGADCNGHGTHVAGTIGGGAGYGVAPDVTLVSARVLDCSGSGSVSGIISALDWIGNNARRPAVVNMSLGGGASLSFDDAVNWLVASGIPVVVAAGNDNADACTASPARAASALTVAATTNADGRASFSNWGACVDIFAPGVAIASAYKTSSTSIAQMSGTSMASPHVAGRVALLLEANPTLTGPGVTNAVLSTSTTGIIGDPAGSANRMIYTGDVTTVTPPPPPPPPPPTTTPPPPPATAVITTTVSLRYSAVGQPIVTVKWSGATTASVDIYRNGAKFINTPNDGVWSDRPKTRGVYTYRVCNAGTSTCSADAAVTI
jgi:subtilisin family serine protease